MKKIDLLFTKAFWLHDNYIGNSGNLDFSDKEFGKLADELEDVQIGYFKDEEVDSDYADRLRKNNFVLSEQEAIDILEHRIEFIEEEFDKPIEYPDFEKEEIESQNTMITKNIIARNEKGSSENLASIKFEVTILDIVNLKKAVAIAKENNFIFSLDVQLRCGSDFLDHDGNITGEWRSDTDFFRVSTTGIVYKALNKWDSSDYIESDYITIEELEGAFKLINLNE